MPPRTTAAGRILVAVAVVLASSAAAPPRRNPPPPTQPTIDTSGQADPQSLTAMRARLASTPAAQRTDPDRALLAAVEFLIAIARPDGAAAAAIVDATGYQPLPARGDLPLDPTPPLRRETLAASLERAAPLSIHAVRASGLRVVRRGELVESEAVALWMLPTDFAVALRPPADAAAGWPAAETCLVVRVRGSKAHIVGGTLLEALDAIRPQRPDGEEK